MEITVLHQTAFVILSGVVGVLSIGKGVKKMIQMNGQPSNN